MRTTAQAQREQTTAWYSVAVESPIVSREVTSVCVVPQTSGQDNRLHHATRAMSVVNRPSPMVVSRRLLCIRVPVARAPPHLQPSIAHVFPLPAERRGCQLDAASRELVAFFTRDCNAHSTDMPMVDSSVR